MDRAGPRVRQGPCGRPLGHDGHVNRQHLLGLQRGPRGSYDRHWRGDHRLVRRHIHMRGGPDHQM
eukprot:scaffold648524_cov48-Prasinocladus_malaysianus.AAC.1